MNEHKVGALHICGS